MTRAYLALDETTDEGGRWLNEINGHLQTLACLKNYGNTPAYDIHIHAQIEPADAEHTAWLFDAKPAGELYPTQERIIVIRSADGCADDEEMLVSWRVDYKSGAGNEHFSVGCFKIVANDGDTPSWMHIAERSKADWLP